MRALWRSRNSCSRPAGPSPRSVAPPAVIVDESTSWVVSFGDLVIGLELDAGGASWTAARGTSVLSARSPIQLLTVAGENLMRGLRFRTASTRTVCESYELAVGKRSGRHDVEHHECSVRFATGTGTDVVVVLRAAADGVALRLVVEGRRGTHLAGGDVSLTLDPSAPVWPLTYTPWYETPRFSATLSTLDRGDYGLPFLAQVDDATYVLVTESDLDGRYGGCLMRYAGRGVLAFTLADDVALGSDSVATPWRVLIAGDLATIVASQLVEDLAPAAEAPIAAWVRPGRCAWSWWSDFYSGAHLDKQLRMLKYAADRGWEYLLVDCGWDAAWMPELVAQASNHGIGVFVWVAWDDIATAQQQRQLAEWASWGVAGIKVDFMESESQERYRWYEAVIRECARVGLMINFHGSVIPRGWSRAHPHVMSYEAVRGAEYYVFYDEPLTPEHNTIVPFSRNVIGSADYTPVTFSAKGRRTTEAHELALAVVLESGLLHFADDIAEYAARPIAQMAIERIPVHWDETRFVAGSPGTHVVLARRSGAEWFIGAISALETISISIDLGTLGLAADYHAVVITDDDDCRLSRSDVVLSCTDTIDLELRRNGGALVILTPATPASVPEARPARPAVEILEPVITAGPGEVVNVRARIIGGAEPHLVLPPGWPSADSADPRHKDRRGDDATPTWSVRVPASFQPGELAVLAVHAGEPLGAMRSVVAHMRIVAPVAPGQTALVGMPYVSG